MVESARDDFSVAFDTQVQAKTFIEQAEERRTGISSCGLNSGNQLQNSGLGLNSGQQLHNSGLNSGHGQQISAACTCPASQHAMQAQCSGGGGSMMHAPYIGGGMMQAPYICCACRMFQSWPRCSCNQTAAVVEAVVREYVPPVKRSTAPEVHETQHQTKLPRIRRDSAILHKTGHDLEKKKTIARQKRQEEKYKVLEPTHYTFDLPKTTLHLTSFSSTVCAVPDRLAPVLAIPPRSSIRIGRRTLFRSREEQTNYNYGRVSNFDTGRLLGALSQLNSSITTKKRSGCCGKSSNTCNMRSTFSQAHQMTMNSPSSMHQMMMNSPTSMHSAWMDQSAMRQAWKGRSLSQSWETTESGEQIYMKTSDPAEGVNELEVKVEDLDPRQEVEVENLEPRQEMMSIVQQVRNARTTSSDFGSELDNDGMRRSTSPAYSAGGSRVPIGSLTTPLDYEDEDGLSPL